LFFNIKVAPYQPHARRNDRKEKAPVSRPVTLKQFGRSDIVVQIDGPMPSISKFLEAALGKAALKKLDANHVQFFFNNDTDPGHWGEYLPDNCHTVWLLRIVTVTVYLNGKQYGTVNVLQGTTITDALRLGDFTEITHQSHRLYWDRYELQMQYWNLKLDADAILKFVTKKRTSEEPMEYEQRF
jgi:hypothetical protein